MVDLDLDEEAIVEFDLAEIAEGDRPLCEIGARFYWSIGYTTAPGGSRSRTSRLHFRRIGRPAR
ncbi:MAG: hypothetical protein ACT4QG_09120 [Sporichthyaceae bacterium]